MIGLTTSTLTASLYAKASPFDSSPDTVDPDAFGRWPAAAQAALVKSFATTTPPAILVGPSSGKQVIATLSDSRGSDVEITPAPASINLTPDQLAIDEFQRWSNEAQVFYTQINGAGTPPSVDIGGYGATATATVTADATGVTLAASAGLQNADAALFGLTPDTIDPDDFFAMTADEQYRYAAKYGAAVPPTVTLGTPDPAQGTRTIALTGGGNAFTVAVPAGTYPGFDDPAAVSKDVFATWPREVQRASVLAKATAEGQTGYPKTVSVGGQLAAIASASADIEISDAPAGFGSAPSASAFLAWPAIWQLAYARLNAASLPLHLPGGANPTLDVALTADGSSVVLSSAADATVGPADLNLDLFQLWSAADQMNYIRTWTAGTPSGTARLLAIGPADAEKALLTTDGTDTVLQIHAYPSDFNTAPALLTPAAFLKWPPAFRAIYTRENGAFDAATGQTSLTVGQGAQQVRSMVNAQGGYFVANSMYTGSPSQAQILDLANPTWNVYGSDGGQNLDPNRTSGNALFPILSGTAGNTPSGALYVIPDADKKKIFYTVTDAQGNTTQESLYDQFQLAPSELAPTKFNQWNSAAQLEYLRKNGLVNGNGQPNAYLTIGANTGAQETAFISSLPQGSTIYNTVSKVYIAENLQKQDISKMSLADQVILAGIPAFNDPTTGVGTLAGLVAFTKDAAMPRSLDPAGAVALPASLTPPPQGNQDDDTYKSSAAYRNYQVNVLFCTAMNQISTPSATSASFPVPGGDGGMSAADKDVFRKEISNVWDQVQKSAIVSPKDLNDQLTEIMNRFSRANAYQMALTTAATAAQGDTYRWSAVPTYARSSTDVATMQSKWNTYTGYASRTYFNVGQAINAMLASDPDLALPTNSPTASSDLQTMLERLLPDPRNVLDPLSGGVRYPLTDSNGNFLTTVIIRATGQKTLEGQTVQNVDFNFEPNIYEAPDGGAPATGVNVDGGTGYWISQLTYSITLAQKPTVSTDDNQTIRSGYTVFMQQERQILALDDKAKALADTGSISNQALDVPNLVYLFQLYANLAGEAKIRADSEEVNQMNALLKTYAVMQRIINNTARNFKKADDGEQPIVGDGPGGSLTAEDQAAMAMFNSSKLTSALTDANKHPEELLKGLTRPTFDLSGSYKQTQWQTFGTQLSDTVNLINQEAQIMTNNINSATKQKDRHFDLANNALSKMSEILQKIAGVS